MKSGKLNFLETSEPLQACNGTGLPFYVLFDGNIHDNIKEIYVFAPVAVFAVGLIVHGIVTSRNNSYI
jgi:hypothetical protein